MNNIYSMFSRNKRWIIGTLLLAVTAFYCSWPLFIRQGLPYIDDMVFHIFQADQFNQAINDGVFYPRWLPDSNNGYGSANFIFYAPLSYYFVSAIKIFIPSLTVSIIIAVWWGFFLSGITMFIATTKMFGRSGSLLSAIIYQILPFHLGDLYIRGTFAELVAFIWFPLIILFMYKTIETRNKMAMVGLSLSYSGLILTHLVSGFMFSLVIAAYFIYNYFLLKDKRPLIKTLFSLALGLGLSSVYLIPAIFEQKFVQIDYIINCSVGDYRKNFLFMWDKFQPGLRDFYLPLHTIVFTEIILFLFIILLIRKNGQRLSNSSQQNFFIFLFLSAVFLTTPLSRTIWDIIPGFSFLQFPWRWVTVMELSLCLMVGTLFSIQGMFGLKFNTFKKKAIIYLIITLFLMSFNTMLKSSQIISNITVKTLDVREYIPVWAKNIEKIMSEEKNERVSVVSGEVLTDTIEWKSEERVVNVNASTYGIIRIATFYYPGWKAYIDGGETGINTEEGVGAILIDIPEGKHTIVLRFVDTPLRYYAKILSLISLCIIVLFILFAKKTYQNPTTGQRYA